MKNSIDRDIRYEDGKVISITTKIEEMDKTLLFRLLENCAIDQMRMVSEVERLREGYKRSKEEEKELREALAVIEEREKENEESPEDIFEGFDEIK